MDNKACGSDNGSKQLSMHDLIGCGRLLNHFEDFLLERGSHIVLDSGVSQRSSGDNLHYTPNQQTTAGIQGIRRQ
jgi:hypothetical protein